MRIINVTQADLDKLPPEIRGNARAMNLIRTVLTTYTKLEQMLGYDLVLVASGVPPEGSAPAPRPDTETPAARRSERRRLRT